MTYSITVQDTTEQAVNFINFVKSLAKDYKFISIEQKDTYFLSAEQEIELGRRLEMMKKNPTQGKTVQENKEFLNFVQNNKFQLPADYKFNREEANER